MEELTTHMKTIFESNTKVLSFNTLRKRLNSGKTKRDTGFVTSKHLSYLLNNSDVFTHVNPQTIGCSKWYDTRVYNKGKLIKTTENIRNRVNLWKMC
jgi:hypothetical protein